VNTTPDGPPSAPAVCENARDEFDLDSCVHLNHGSFGAVPRSVLRAQEALRNEQNRNFHKFYDDQLFPRMDASRKVVATWLGAGANGLVYTKNATSAVATAVDTLCVEAGELIIATSEEYSSTLTMLRETCARTGAELHIVDTGGERTADVAARILTAAADGRTAAVVVSHVSSAAGRRYPIQALHDGLESARATLIIDGAHGPGLLPVDVGATPGAFYCAGLHKWACFPRGAGALYVPPQHRENCRPLVGSWYAESETMADRFLWSGTDDYTAYLVAADVLAVHHHADTRGWGEGAEKLGDYIRERVGEALPGATLISDPSIRRLRAWAIPGISPSRLNQFLLARKIRVQTTQTQGQPVLRVSAGWYNSKNDVDRLTNALRKYLQSAA